MIDLSNLISVLDLGGPVVALLLAVSVVTGAVIFYKIWQFRAAGVGRHQALAAAIAAWDRGDAAQTQRDLARARSYLAGVVALAVAGGGARDLPDRLRAEAETRFLRLERGLRFLDTVAQIAPLLGLFGTVLGMIEAFQALQQAGDAVDPSLLAGGIWVALLTTAVGLGVAMPTAMVLSWFEGRMEAERVFADRAITTILAPGGEAPQAGMADVA